MYQNPSDVRLVIHDFVSWPELAQGTCKACFELIMVDQAGFVNHNTTANRPSVITYNKWKRLTSLGGSCDFVSL